METEYKRSSDAKFSAAWEIGAIVALVTIAIALLAATMYESRRRRRRTRMQQQQALAAEGSESVASQGLLEPRQPERAMSRESHTGMVYKPPQYYWARR